MADEKRTDEAAVAALPNAPSEDSLPPTATGDDALDFLKEHGTEGNFAHDAARMRILRRKIDIRVIPFLALSYLMNYLDKITLNYANVMGLSKELKVKGNDYKNASSAFWIAVLIEFPASMVYQKEQIVRFVWWYLGTTGGMVVGGFVSWCFQHVSKDAPLAGWRIMYIVIGRITLLIATVIWFFVPDTPMQARFLTDLEKVSLLDHVRSTKRAFKNQRSFSFAQFREALLDFQLRVQWLIMILEGGGGGSITAYSATLIKGFGYTPKKSALLNMGSGPVAITMCLLTLYGVRFFGNRWAFLIFTTCPGIIGAALIAYLPKNEKTGLLASIYLVSSIFAAVPIQFSWITANVAGHTRKAYATTLLNAAFAVCFPTTLRDPIV